MEWLERKNKGSADEEGLGEESRQRVLDRGRSLTPRKKEGVCFQIQIRAIQR